MNWLLGGATVLSCLFVPAWLIHLFQDEHAESGQQGSGVAIGCVSAILIDLIIISIAAEIADRFL